MSEKTAVAVATDEASEIINERKKDVICDKTEKLERKTNGHNARELAKKNNHLSLTHLYSGRACDDGCHNVRLAQ